MPAKLMSAVSLAGIATMMSVCSGERAEAQDYAPYEMECASSGYDFTTCQAPQGFWIDSARLVRQLSTAACVEGTSWGHDRRRIWVSQGCRARFALVGGVGGGAEPLDLRCGSAGYEPNYCSAEQQVLSARLVTQRSSADCLEGASWGWDAGGVWVTNGCRGDFRLNDPADLPGSVNGGGWDGDDGGSDWDRPRPRYTEAQAMAACQRVMIETAWENGDYSVQFRRNYEVERRRGWNFSGRAVLFGPDGHQRVNVACRFARGEVRELDITPAGD